MSDAHLSWGATTTTAQLIAAIFLKVWPPLPVQTYHVLVFIKSRVCTKYFVKSNYYATRTDVLSSCLKGRKNNAPALYEGIEFSFPAINLI